MGSCAAKALIPDDDDEELIDIAKSRRKERVATEKSVEKNFVKGGDYKGTDLTRVQNAVNKLAKEGLSLESGDLKSLAKTSRYVESDPKATALHAEVPSSPAWRLLLMLRNMFPTLLRQFHVSLINPCCSESWIGDLKKAVADLSGSPTSQKSSTQVSATLDSLGKAFADSDLDKAKESFADAVGALQTWIGDAGLTQQIKGL